MTATEPRTYPFASEKLDLDPLYAALRSEEPLCRVRLPYGEPAWLATRYEDVKVVLGDPRFSRAAAVGRDQPRARPYPAGAGAMISLDPPEHSRLRRLVARAFTMRRIESLRPRVQQIADGLVDAMLAEGPPVDLVHAFGLPLPIAVMCELLGVPFEDRSDFRQWADAYLSTSKFTEEQVADARTQLRGSSPATRPPPRRSPTSSTFCSPIPTSWRPCAPTSAWCRRRWRNCSATSLPGPAARSRATPWRTSDSAR
jgi:cytochrome P450